MPRGWPPLDRSEVCAILMALGLRPKHTSGGHEIWKGLRRGKGCMVPVSTHIRQFNVDLLQSMCKQAGSNRHEFYGATEGTAKKIR